MKTFKQKAIAAFMLLVCATQSVTAQKMKVTKFELNAMNPIAQSQPKTDANGDKCAAIVIKCPVECDVKSAGRISFERSGIGEYLTYVTPAVHWIEVQAEGYLPLRVTFADYEVGALAGENTYTLELTRPAGYDEKAPLLLPTGWYLGAGYTLGSLSGLTAMAGGSYKSWDLELSYRIGLSESDVVNWYTSTANDNYLTHRAGYKLNAIGVKAGYHFNAHRTLTVVPQVGMSIHKLSANLLDGTEALGDGSTCANAVVGAKVVFSPLRRIAVYIAPEYNIALSKSDTYQAIADAANFSVGGFYCSAGVMFHF